VTRVAVTGGIATGKSGVLRRFAKHRVPTVDADVLAREALAPETPCARRVADRFGPDILDGAGRIDRAALARIVFANPAARVDLERIVHPVVYEAIERWFDSLPSDGRFAVADIPLLFETNHQGDFDLVVVTRCAPDEQVARLMKRDGIGEADARARIAAQWPAAEKVVRADVVIDTSGAHEETDAQVDALVARLSV
jgi:dephospho-CoA kinase